MSIRYTLFGIPKNSAEFLDLARRRKVRRAIVQITGISYLDDAVIPWRNYDLKLRVNLPNGRGYTEHREWSSVSPITGGEQVHTSDDIYGRKKQVVSLLEASGLDVIERQDRIKEE